MNSTLYRALLPTCWVEELYSITTHIHTPMGSVSCKDPPTSGRVCWELNDCCTPEPQPPVVLPGLQVDITRVIVFMFIWLKNLQKTWQTFFKASDFQKSQRSSSTERNTWLFVGWIDWSLHLLITVTLFLPCDPRRLPCTGLPLFFVCSFERVH